MSAGFTPGPWRFDGEPDNHIVWHGADNRVCFLASTGATTANAHLIAAAPDLYEALLRALPAVQADRDCLVESHTMPIGDLATLDPDVKPDIDAMDAALDAMRAALAKARGEA